MTSWEIETELGNRWRHGYFTETSVPKSTIHQLEIMPGDTGRKTKYSYIPMLAHLTVLLVLQKTHQLSGIMIPNYLCIPLQSNQNQKGVDAHLIKAYSKQLGSQVCCLGFILVANPSWLPLEKQVCTRACDHW